MTPFDIIVSQTEAIMDGLPKKKLKTFEDFLQEKHAENYNGTDDDMPDAFDGWVSELDVQEIMDYADEWGKKLQS